METEQLVRRLKVVLAGSGLREEVGKDRLADVDRIDQPLHPRIPQTHSNGATQFRLIGPNEFFGRKWVARANSNQEARDIFQSH